MGRRSALEAWPAIPLAILACLLWSSAFTGIKIGLRHSGPYFFAGIRFMLSGVMLIPFCCKDRPLRTLLQNHRRHVLLIAFTQTFFLYALFYTGMTLVQGATAAIIIGAAPLINAVFAHFFMHNDTMTRARAGSLGLGLTGVAVLSLSRQPWSASGRPLEFLGIGILLFSTFSGAAAQILVSRYKAPIPPLTLNAVQIFTGGAGLFLLSLVLEGIPDFSKPLSFYLALGWLSFLSAAALSIWFVLLRRPDTRISEINLWKFLIPVFGAGLSWMLLPEESPDGMAVLGMICVAASILLFHRVSRPAVNPAEPSSA